MQLKTKYHGVHEYEEEEIINFSKGICGFEHLKKFIIFPVEGEEVFNILHSIEDDSIGFVITSPFIVQKDYEFKLDQQVIERLKINTPEDVLILSIVTLNSNIKKITTNLRAPLIINIKEKLGEQIILNNDKYLIKHPIFKEEN